MNNHKYLLDIPTKNKEYKITTLVENETKFCLNNCEFSIYETFQNASNFKLHFTNLAFTAMLQGKKHMKIDNKTNYFDYQPGECVLVAPGETMVIDFPEAYETPAKCISLNLNTDFVKNYLEQMNFQSPKTDELSSWNIQLDDYFLSNNKSLASATNNIMRIAMEDNTQKDILADFAIKELLIKLMQTQARNIVERNVINHHSRLHFVVDYIKNNLHQKLSIESISKLAYVSKTGFFKMFKEEFGISPNDFIINERIKKAKQLLGLKNSIKEVADLTGFSDTNYFTRVFKQLVGITPKLYQNNLLLD